MDLRSEVFIDAPAHVAWAALGDRFGDIGAWATPITASSLEGEARVGAVRTCHTARFGPVPTGTIRERLVAFDPAARSLAYEAVAGLPPSITRAVNRWSVRPQGEQRCVVRTQARVELRGPAVLLRFLLQRSMQANGARALADLQYWVEHGRPHPRKVAAARGAAVP
jgi:hypothetical protein